MAMYTSLIKEHLFVSGSGTTKAKLPDNINRLKCGGAMLKTGEVRGGRGAGDNSG